MDIFWGGVSAVPSGFYNHIYILYFLHGFTIRYTSAIELVGIQAIFDSKLTEMEMGFQVLHVYTGHWLSVWRWRWADSWTFEIREMSPQQMDPEFLSS